MEAAPVRTAMQSVYRPKPVILCVDDYKDVLDTLEHQLDAVLGHKFKIVLAESGTEGLEIVEEYHKSGRDIAVVISDQIMPGMNGDDFLIALHEQMPETVKVMLTGQADLENVGKAINKANLYRYISKPWDPEDFKLTVEAAARSWESDKRIKEQNAILQMLNDATEAIARSLDLDELTKRLAGFLLEFSQAERAAILVKREGRFEVKCMAQKEKTEFFDEASYQDFSNLPHSIIDESLKSNEEIICQDAQSNAAYNADPYIAKHGVKSIFSMPVLNLGNLVGLIYLENQNVAQFFTEETRNILRMLASKSAIAIENAIMYDQLEQTVEIRTDKLRDTLDELMAANSHKDKILRIVSHDIRGPLSGISELSQNLQDPDIAGDTDEVKNFGGIIQRSSQKVLSMVNDILDLAKLETGELVLNKDEADLSDLLKSAVDMHKPKTQSKNINLEISGNGALNLELDSSKFSQALNNLISNAIKFTPKGGNVILGYDEHKENGTEYARVQVADTGVGIPKDDIDKIFEKFTKMQRSGTSGEKGTGLGLSIVKEIVELHGGRIEVDSDEGVGTTFTILIPKS